MKKTFNQNPARAKTQSKTKTTKSLSRKDAKSQSRKVKPESHLTRMNGMKGIKPLKKRDFGVKPESFVVLVFAPLRLCVTKICAFIPFIPFIPV
ncbi:hypothetical protein [Geomonas ferrireducens]|uniref:hypothetical protein n=1 Tax=Geomonas ferrireducens TaxID=2570227 RepID=UPI0010A87EB0|nr:hypothetical protein [Geomonas ferrireducens]